MVQDAAKREGAMDTRKLAYFVQIVDSGSITKAAAALHVAQPALSQQVSALENDLKQRLLIRSKQGVKPTAAGHTLYRHAQSSCGWWTRPGRTSPSPGQHRPGACPLRLRPTAWPQA